LLETERKKRMEEEKVSIEVRSGEMENGNPFSSAPHRYERIHDPRFAKKVTFLHQFRAMFMMNFTLQYKSWAVLLCQVVAPFVILLVAGLMQFITNSLIAANNVTVPGSGEIPFPQSMPTTVPCLLNASTDGHPGECVTPWANLMPSVGYDVAFLETYVEQFSKYKIKLDELYSCHQQILYNLPHFYYVNNADADLGELSPTGVAEGFLGRTLDLGRQFTFATSFPINARNYSNGSYCARNFDGLDDYSKSIKVPFFSEFNSSFEIDDTLVDIIDEYEEVSKTSPFFNSQYRSLYEENPKNRELFVHIMKLVQDGNYLGHVRPKGGFIFNKFSPENATLDYTVVGPQMALYNEFDTHAKDHLISMIHNAWFKTLANISEDGPVIKTFISPLPSSLLPVTIDVTAILGGALYPFATTLLFPILVLALVRDRREKYLIMMEQNGLDRWTYWTIMYIYNYALYAVVIGIVFVASFIFQIRLVTQTNALPLILTFVLWGHGLITQSFLFSNFFSRPRTAVIVCVIILYIQVTLLELLEFINVIPIDEAPFFLVMMYAPWTFYRLLGYMDNACLRMQCYDISILGSLNLFTQGLLYLLGTSILSFLLSAYLSYVLPSEYGIRKSPFFPLTALYNLIKKVFCTFCKNKKICRNDEPLSTFGIEAEGDSEEKVDEDVLAEEERLRQGLPFDVPVVMYKLRKEYSGGISKPPHIAVHGLSLVIEKNECFGLLGPNGAGKTTLISVLTGLFEPTSGVAKVAGFDLKNEINSVYHHIGVCPQFDIQFPQLTTKEHLLFYARLRGVKWTCEKQVVQEALQQVNLVDAQNKRSKNLSGGMRRRLSVAMACIGNPDILILDEPTTGLDPQSRRQVWEVIENVKSERSVILTTHAMEEADHLCTRIGIMHYGKLRCLGSQNRLKTKFGSGYQLQFDSRKGKVAEVEAFVASAIPQAMHVETYSNKCTYQIDEKDMVVSELFETIDSALSKVPIVDWGVKRTTLEDVFLNIVHHGKDRRTPQNRSLLSWIPFC
jgi:ABC-type multidrug transport system ATPase subunit